MPRFRGSLVGLHFAKEPFSKTMDAAIQRLIKGAAREWLRAMIVQVPVWSGETRGPIKFARGPNGNLARFLNVSIPIVPRQRRENKNEQTGARKGRWNMTAANHVYRFYFRSDVIQYMHNEFFARSDPGAGGQQVIAPWHSLEVGRDAFEHFVQEGKAKLPRIQNAITTFRIPIGT